MAKPDDPKILEKLQLVSKKLTDTLLNKTTPLWKSLLKEGKEGKALVNAWNEKLNNDALFVDFCKKFFTGAQADKYISKIRDLVRIYHSQDDKKESAKNKILSLILLFYREKVLSEHQEPLRRILPEEMMKFLPANLVVKVDPNHEIEEISALFDIERKSIENKIMVQKLLVRKYNAVVAKVKKDMKSSDPDTKMCAVITAIMMETGIRPGKEGNAATIRTEDGDKVVVETFGAATLSPEHLNFIRDDFVELSFVGKKGGTNTAQIRDQELIRILRLYAEDARKGNQKFIFKHADGKVFQYNTLIRYFYENFKHFRPTDFRKLKATQEVLDSLVLEQKALYKKIRGFIEEQKEDLKERVAEEIILAVKRAYEKAQEALSHDNVGTTIGAYINPEILLRFLSRGSIEDNLEKVLLSGKSTLAFDPDVFIQKALMEKTSSWKKFR